MGERATGPRVFLAVLALGASGCGKSPLTPELLASIAHAGKSAAAGGGFQSLPVPPVKTVPPVVKTQVPALEPSQTDALVKVDTSAKKAPLGPTPAQLESLREAAAYEVAGEIDGAIERALGDLSAQLALPLPPDLRPLAVDEMGKAIRARHGELVQAAERAADSAFRDATARLARVPVDAAAVAAARTGILAAARQAAYAKALEIGRQRFEVWDAE